MRSQHPGCTAKPVNLKSQQQRVIQNTLSAATLESIRALEIQLATLQDSAAGADEARQIEETIMALGTGALWPDPDGVFVPTSTDEEEEEDTHV